MIWFSTFAPVLFSIPAVGIVLNVIVVVSILRNSLLNKIANVFFLNQALADTLFLSLVPFILLEFYLDNWVFGEGGCRLLILLDTINQFSSVFLLAVMSVDRYLIVSRPLRRLTFRTKKYAWLLSLCTWVLAAVLASPLLFISQSFSDEDSKTHMCYFLADDDDETAQKYKFVTVYAFLVGFLLPLSFILWANVSILGHIRRTKRNRKELPRINVNNREKARRKRRKTCAIIVTCTVIFVLCWLPLYMFLGHSYFIKDHDHAHNTLITQASNNCTTIADTVAASNATSAEIQGSSNHQQESQGAVRMFCLLLSYSGGMLNPLVLLTMSKSVRKSFYSSARGRRNFDISVSRFQTSPNTLSVERSKTNSKSRDCSPHKELGV